MSLMETIRTKINEAMKNRDDITRNILKVALGEIQSIEYRNGKITEEEAQKAVRKIISNNQEAIKMIEKNPLPDINSAVFGRVYILRQENKILDELLPNQMTKEALVAFFHFDDVPIIKEVLVTPNDGKAIGLAMKYFKESNVSVDGKMVAEVIKDFRKANPR